MWSPIPVTCISFEKNRATKNKGLKPSEVISKRRKPTCRN